MIEDVMVEIILHLDAIFVAVCLILGVLFLAFPGLMRFIGRRKRRSKHG